MIQKLHDGLNDIPVLDMHTHLIGGRLAARGLHDVLLYHMGVSELYSAGCPNGARLTEYPGWPDEKEAHARIREALPFLPLVKNTHISWGARIILRDLYGWTEPVTMDNWQRLDALIRERAEDRAWHREILDRVGIRRSCTELARRGNSEDDDRLQYALESAMFARCQWGEFDTALYELERFWGQPLGSPTPIGKGRRPPAAKTIRTLADVHAAMEHYLNAIPYGRVISTATSLSTQFDYRLVSDAEMETALKRRDRAGAVERDTYASYILEAFLAGLEQHGDAIVFQFAIGFEPLPFETGSFLSQRALLQLAEIIARHPRLHFQAFVASRHANQTLCTIAREVQNLSLVGFWWHNFYPDIIRSVMTERLDMLPLNRQIGFFSDAYCIEWAYAKIILVRKQLATVLAAKIAQGQYTLEDALAVARATLFDTPRTLLKMTPY
ncbi:MAG: hypothetical protein HY360_03795 [Verrucomicrobia bacterium]|nr:hypothetical protein [Verrucomicrobiota bacterium]